MPFIFLFRRLRSAIIFATRFSYMLLYLRLRAFREFHIASLFHVADAEFMNFSILAFMTLR